MFASRVCISLIDSNASAQLATASPCSTYQSTEEHYRTKRMPKRKKSNLSLHRPKRRSDTQKGNCNINSQKDGSLFQTFKGWSCVQFTFFCYVVGNETLSNNLTPFNYITLCIEDINYRTTMLILECVYYTNR